jgi:polyphosphate kinase
MTHDDELMNPDYYINRELSWLEFNERVLEEAQDVMNPLLERLKFLAIVASNLDEFFMVRVAGLKKQVAAGITRPCPAGLSPSEQVARIAEKAHKMIENQDRCFAEEVVPLLLEHNIKFLSSDEITEKQRTFLNEYYHREIYPVLTPMAIDASHPFPFIASASLNLIFTIDNKEPSLYSVVQVPDVLPRFIRLPGKKDEYAFMLLEDVIVTYFNALYPDMTLRESNAFRIIRDSDLAIHEEESYDLIREIELELRKRRHGAAVRLAISAHASEEVLSKLKEELDIEDEDIYTVDGPLNLKDFMRLPSKIELHALKDPPVPPLPIAGVPEDGDIFSSIKEGDIFLHHPYHSFRYVINLIENASHDPGVLAIKMTLYRVSGDSPIVKALIDAAEKGKQVTTLVELKARFDEERNIEWARKLERAGVHVIYGLIGLKTHSKICLIIRREPEGICRYVHMSTGNYNDTTARLYTDIGLMTCDESLGQDISALFNVLTGYSRPPRWNKIEVAPTGLRKKIIRLIQREANRSTENQPGQIMAKMNSLLDQEIIYNLYKASQKGVKIDLIVRGICCVRPGIKEVSENIRVISIIDRFLEHSRIFFFKNGGNEELYLSSADWMPRNMDRRVELFFPVDDEKVKEEVMNVLEAGFKDNVKARALQSDGSYKRCTINGKPFRSQEELYKMTCKALTVNKEKEEVFIPHKSHSTV